MSPDVSIIIVSWNVHDLLKENLHRLFSLSHSVSFEVILVDNGSTDETSSMLRSTFSQVEFIQNDTNRGFAFACNQGLKIARGNILILFNPDMLMGEHVLDHTFHTLMQDKDIGVMGVKLMRKDGSLVSSIRRDPQLLDQLCILLKLPHLFPAIVNRYLAKNLDENRSQTVEQIRGSFFAFRRDVMEKVGLLDEKNFFVWFEEVDYCKRVRQVGFRVWYSAEVSCIDLVGRAFAQQSVRLKQQRLSLSMARYFRKWHPAWQAALIYAFRPFVIFGGACADLMNYKSSLWK